MYRKIKNTINWTFKVLSILFVIVFGVITYKNIDPFNHGYATTDFLGYQPYIVKSDSMNPVFYAGDAVIAKVVEDPASEIKEGDIISYTVGDPLDRNIIIHRIIDIEGENIVLQGDNNNVADINQVCFDNVQAKYLFRIPLVGWLLNATSNIYGIIALIVCAFALVWFYDSIWDILDAKFDPEDDNNDQEEIVEEVKEEE